MNKTIALVLLVISQLAYGSVPVVSDTDSLCGFLKPVDGIKEVIKGDASTNKHHEYGGVVVEMSDGTICVTHPVTSQSEVALNYEVALSKGSKIIAMYHTHPNAPYNKKSHTQLDIQVAHNLRVSSYVVSWKDDTIRVYNPSSKKIRSLGKVD